MSFYDIDLKEQVAGKHLLWEIEKRVTFSGLMYRFNDLAEGVGRSGFGVDVGIKALYLQCHYDLSDRAIIQNDRETMQRGRDHAIGLSVCGRHGNHDQTHDLGRTGSRVKRWGRGIE